MRPLRLELEGFSTFRERVCLDFDGLDLVAFTGATGAGKSTLIDAITFALYGSVARYDNTSRVAPVIHQLANQAKVRLDFETGGRHYVATRVVRRRTGPSGDADSATTKEARLELVADAEPAADTAVLAGDVRELNTAVEELLGLDFRQFTRTIVLPQGEFAAFLRDDPSTRDKLLQRLLDLGVYERMGKLARSQAKKSGNQAEILLDQQRRNPPLTDAELAALTAGVTELGRLRAAAADELATLDDLDTRLDPLRDQVRTIDAGIGRLDAVDVPAALPDLARELDEAAAARTAAADTLAAGRTARDDAQAAVDALPDRVELVRTLSVVEQKAESEAKIGQLETELADVAETAGQLEAEQLAVGEALDRAEHELRAARRALDAAGWTATLAVGDPCPVCHREVDSIPDHDAAAEAEVAEAEHQRLESESTSIATGLAKARGIEAASTEEIERQRERVDLLALQLSTFDGETTAQALTAQLEAVEAAEQRLRTATTAVTELEARLEEAAATEAKLGAAMQAIHNDLTTLRDSLADQQPPALGHRSLLGDFEALARWATERSATLTAERGELAEEGKRMANQRASVVAALTALGNEAGLQVEPVELVDALVDAIAEAKASAATAEQRRADHDRLSEQIVALDADRVLNDALGKHLRSGGFGSWLLAEALDNIVAKATVWLLELSNNQYSLVAGDRSFAIIDHNNADEVRDVRTLSGGETFLASLALALALADSIAELAPVDAPRLESMFLDEGFGTLDPATLDVVAGAIEELASTGRMIGIVTHVSDLAERMPARFEVAKGPSSSTVELVEV